MKLNKARGVLYLTAKVLGDANAVKKGKVARRVAGKLTGRGLGKLFR